MRKFRNKNNKKPKQIGELIKPKEKTIDNIGLESSDVLTSDSYPNTDMISTHLANSDDIVFRHFVIPTIPNIKATVVFINNLADGSILESSVLVPLTQGVAEKSLEDKTHLYSQREILVESILSNSNISYVSEPKSMVEEILMGNGILLMNDFSSAVSISMAKEAHKKHSESKTEKVILGPQQGFVEDLSINISLIRKRIKSPNLVIKNLKIGRETRTELSIIYLDNIAEYSLIKELFRRLEQIDVDGIIGTKDIDDYISDAPVNLIPTTFNTERPDRVHTMLLEGRVALICDGNPFVLVIPCVISDFMASPEEYYDNRYFASLNRLMAYVGTLVVMFLPALYIAITTFHHEMIPTRLSLTLAGTRAGVPYPAFVEALMMEIAFEALREAGTRLPTHIGQTVSIVGALIIGQSAVEAGLVSPAVVIIVATTAIFSFTIPYNNLAVGLRLTRFINMTLAATLGIYGVMTGALIISLNLISLRSFGVPFMVPLAPLNLEEMKKWVFSFPQWAIDKRSKHITKKNIIRQSENSKPGTTK